MKGFVLSLFGESVHTWADTKREIAEEIRRDREIRAVRLIMAGGSVKCA